MYTKPLLPVDINIAFQYRYCPKSGLFSDIHTDLSLGEIDEKLIILVRLGVYLVLIWLG